MGGRRVRVRRCDDKTRRGLNQRKRSEDATAMLALDGKRDHEPRNVGSL